MFSPVYNQMKEEYFYNINTGNWTQMRTFHVELEATVR